MRQLIKLHAIIAIISILIAMGVGLYLKYFSTQIDSPIEQIAEKILKANEIEYDFSKDKKVKSHEDTSRGC